MSCSTTDNFVRVWVWVRVAWAKYVENILWGTTETQFSGLPDPSYISCKWYGQEWATVLIMFHFCQSMQTFHFWYHSFLLLSEQNWLKDSQATPKFWVWVNYLSRFFRLHKSLPVGPYEAWLVYGPLVHKPSVCRPTVHSYPVTEF